MVERGRELVPASTRQKIDAYFARGLQRLGAGAVEATRAGRIGVARTRFREGFTTEEQFTEELRLLRLPDEDIKLELTAGRLDYATDFIRDLIAAYRDAVRKGHITMDEYRDALTNIGVVPERAMGYVIRERARLKPEEALTPASPARPYYETDAGHTMVDTIRRRRRKSLISRDQELAGFLEIGMPVDLATAYADNDDVRLAEKGGEGE